MRKIKTWIKINWLTVLLHVMFWTTYWLYKSGFPPIWVLSGFVLTTAIARAEGDYKQSFKTDYFYKQLMKHLEKK